jgi:hypothetical protein
MDMRKMILFIISAVVLAGCAENKNAELEPEETLDKFYERLCAGEINEAMSLCDTLAMKDYINSINQTWETTGEAVRAILPAILSETVVDVTDVVKNGEERTVFYKLTASSGQNKEKIATLRKEERAWKITAITDRH